MNHYYRVKYLNKAGRYVFAHTPAYESYSDAYRYARRVDDKLQPIVVQTNKKPVSWLYPATLGIMFACGFAVALTMGA